MLAGTAAGPFLEVGNEKMFGSLRSVAELGRPGARVHRATTGDAFLRPAMGARGRGEACRWSGRCTVHPVYGRRDRRAALGDLRLDAPGYLSRRWTVRRAINACGSSSTSWTRSARSTDSRTLWRGCASSEGAAYSASSQLPRSRAPTARVPPKPSSRTAATPSSCGAPRASTAAPRNSHPNSSASAKSSTPHTPRPAEPGDWRSSTTTSQQLKIEPAVMASEIERLPDLAGFLKLASIPDWQTVTLTRQSNPPRPPHGAPAPP